MNAIEMKHITKTYPSFSLNDVSFTLPSGCVMGLIGENGAGKSTTIRLLMDTVKRDAGEVLILGTSNQSAEFQTVKEEIGIVLDEAYFPQNLNAKQVNILMKSAYKNWQEDIFFGYLKQFGLAETKRFKDFSRGMKMKLSIAAALSHQPKLLILDEATSGLDPVARDEIIELFNDFTREEDHSILISSHILSDLEKICDYIAYLHHGRLLFFEEKDLLKEKYGILKISSSALPDIPEDAVLAKKESRYSTELFVRRSLLSDAFETEPAGIEDIMLFFAKKEDSLK